MPTLPPLLSSSFDSPDLEVKRYMDDSCSSISSMDSIDHHRDFINTSMSSIESFDMVSGGDSTIISTAATPSSIRVQEQQHQQHPIPIFIDQSRCCGRLETVDNESTTSHKMHDSLSSLDTSTCSSDSMYSVTHDKPAMPVVPLQSVVCSSNEGTLTNSPVGPCSICVDSQTDATASCSGSPVHKETCSPSGDSSAASLSPVKQEKRIRKTSWINPMSMKGDNGYPATLDKLISLFHHPSTIFNRQSSKSTVTADESSEKKDISSAQSQLQQQEDKPPSRKESPMGGLFAWTTIGHRKDAAADDPHNAEHLHVPLKSSQETSKKVPLQPNCSPENSITQSSNPIAELASTSQIHATVVSVPERLHKEMKENISPEHTITTASIVSVKSQMTASNAVVPAPPHAHPTHQLLHQQHVEDAAALATSCAERVHFELGGDDDDDDEQNDDDYSKVEQDDDDDGLEKRVEARLSTSSLPTVPIRYPSTTAGNSADSSAGSSHGRMPSGLGQITRDSLSIINGTSKNSQDSMRSLESLSEIDNNVFK